MPEAFNPYYHLLGIPLGEQPPNHYRLLGVRPLEYDPAAIQRAADERAAHLRQYQSTQYAAVAEGLLREVAAASACLLNRQQKAAYDGALRQTLAGGAAAPGMVAAQPPMQSQPAPPQPMQSQPMQSQPMQSQPMQSQPVQSQPVQSQPVPPRPIPVASAGAPATPGMGSPVAVATDTAPTGAGRKRLDSRLVAAAAVVAAIIGIAWAVWPGESDVAGSTDPEQVASSSTTEGDGDGAVVDVPEDPDADDTTETSTAEPLPAETTESPKTLPVEPAEAGPPADDPAATGENPVSPAATPPAAEPPRPAKTLLRQGDVEVEIESAAIDVVKTAGSLSSHTLALSSPDKKCLVLDIQIRNTSDSRTANYVRWGGTTLFDVPVRMTDDVDVLYRQVATLTPPGQGEVENKPSVATLTERTFRAVSRRKEPVVVFFWAPWSESCRNLSPSIDHLSAEYGDAIKVARFQVPDGTSPDTFAATPFIVRMEVNTIPYVIVFHGGKVVKRFAGPVGLGELEDAVDALLPEKVPPHEKIGPGTSFAEQLIFERPAESATYLKLELPAAAFGGSGPLEFEIPRAMIKDESQ